MNPEGPALVPWRSWGTRECAYIRKEVAYANIMNGLHFTICVGEIYGMSFHDPHT